MYVHLGSAIFRDILEIYIPLLKCRILKRVVVGKEYYKLPDRTHSHKILTFEEKGFSAVPGFNSQVWPRLENAILNF